MSPLFYKYDSGAFLIPSALRRAVMRSIPQLAPAFAANKVSLKDGETLGLRREMWERLLLNKVWIAGTKYEKDAWDCDDYSAVARGLILLAGRQHQLEGTDHAGQRRRAGLDVSELCHYANWTPEYHDALLIMDSNAKPGYFEPQTLKLTWDLPSVLKSGHEVWG